ncbi:hypothetical protein [Nonomuraea sp. NPDC050202]|uniref:hypothetical protein n=1 Tax=Nonomuraea sp. NPDC050202 TaxID=3155035 RepID=UPI00340B3394
MAVYQWSRFGVQYKAAVLEVKEFDPDQPRGWHGRWIKVGSVVRLHGGGRATVTGNMGDWYQVRHASGHVTTIHTRQIAAVVSTPGRQQRGNERKPGGVVPGRAAEAADLDTLDERLWGDLDPAGRRRPFEFEASNHDLFMRNRALAKRQISEDLTRRTAHVSDEYVLEDYVREVLARIKSGESIMVRSPTPYVAKHAQPDSPELPNDLADWEYQELLPEEWANAQERMHMRDFEVIDADRYRDILRRNAVASLVAAWAQNSASPRSLAVQIVARDMFGLQRTTLNDVDDFKLEMALEILDRQRPFIEAFARAQYEATQQWLRDAGVTHLHVLRGMVWNPVDLGDELPAWAGPERGPDAYEEEVPLRPLSSFTLSPFTAQEFVGQEGDPDWQHEHGLVIDGTIPAERVFALPRTGIGCLDEWEAVVLGGTDRWRVSARTGKYRFYLRHLIAAATTRYEQIVATEFARRMNMMDELPDVWPGMHQKTLAFKEIPMAHKRTWDVWLEGRLVTDLTTCAKIAGMSEEDTARDLLAQERRVDVPAELLEECRRALNPARPV